MRPPWPWHRTPPLPLPHHTTRERDCGLADHLRADDQARLSPHGVDESLRPSEGVKSGERMVLPTTVFEVVAAATAIYLMTGPFHTTLFHLRLRLRLSRPPPRNRRLQTLQSSSYLYINFITYWHIRKHDPFPNNEPSVPSVPP